MNAKVERMVTWGAVAFVPLALLVAVRVWPPLVADVSQPAGIGQRTVFLPQGAAAEQTFESAGDHIDGVGVLVLTPGQGNGKVTISVRPAGETGDSTAARSVVVRRGGITPTELVHARFPRLLTRPGDTYVLSVNTDTVMSLGSAGHDVYAGGELSAVTESDSNDLIFRVYRTLNGHDLTRGLVGAPAWVAVLLVGVAAFVAGWALQLLLRLDRPLP